MPTLRSTSRNAGRALALLTPLFLAACGEDPAGPEDPGPSAPADVDGYVGTLPDWETFSPTVPDSDLPTGDPQMVTRVVGEGADQQAYECTETPKSIWRTPNQIVTYEPNASIMWVGNLIQGQSYVGGQGSFEELSIRQRAPLKISIDLLTGENFAIVENPTLTSVQSAIGELIQRATDAGLRSGSSIDLTQVDMSYAYEAMLRTGVSASLVSQGIPVELGGGYEVQIGVDLNARLAHITQKMFTISIELPQSPADFFSDELTPELLQQQIDAGNIGPDNPPVYVASITYGRTLTYTMIGASVKAAMEQAVEASVVGVPAGGELSAEVSVALETSAIKLTSIGGEGQNLVGLIRNADLASFFTTDAPLTTARPISYQLNNLGDNSIAKLSQTTNYTLRTCEPKPSTPGLFSFLPEQTAATGIGTPYDARAADVNGDGRTDLVLSHLAAANETVIALGNADGTFTFGGVITHPETPAEGWLDDYDLHVGDFDDDGLDDLVWNRTRAGEPNRIWVALSDGTGGLSFLAPQDFGTAWADEWEALVGDSDGTGGDDLIFNYRSATSNFVWVAESNGDGTFTLRTDREDHPVAGNWASYRALVTDVDVTGQREDVVWNRIASTGPNRTWVGVSGADAIDLTGAAQDYLSGWTGYVAHTGDINGDGRGDLVWTRGTSDSYLHVHRALGQPDGTFQFVSDVVQGARGDEWTDGVSASGFLGDFTGDGRDDVLFNQRTQDVNVLRVGNASADTEGYFAFNTATQTHTSPDPDVDWTRRSVLIGDVTGDGVDEIIWIAPEATTSIHVASPN